MSKLTEDIQETIDQAHGLLEKIEHSPEEVEVASSIMLAHELFVEARLAARRMKGEGWQRKGVIAQLAVLEQAVTEAFHRAISRSN